MKDFRVYYDDKEDILYLAKEGEEPISKSKPAQNTAIKATGDKRGFFSKQLVAPAPYRCR